MAKSRNLNLPECIVPDYGKTSLLAVLPAVASALGVAGNLPSSDITYADCQAALELPDSQQVVLVMCDGLGYFNLDQHRAYAPFLRSRWADIKQLTSTFPSTTASALTGLGTGAPPGKTGMVGYTVRVPNTGALTKGGTGILANLVSWTQQRDPTVIASASGNQGAAAFNMEPTKFQRVPAVLEILANAGVSVLTTGPDKFAGSGLTRAAFRAGRFHGDQSLGGRVGAVRSFIRQSSDKLRQSAAGVYQPSGKFHQPVGAPKCAYLYWGDVDKQGHGSGPQSAKWAEALAHFDHEFERLIRGLPAGTLVVLTADHGQIAVNRDNQIDVAQVPQLARGVALVGGEARALHVYAYDSMSDSTSGIETRESAGLIAERWRDYLGERALVWTRAEAIAAGLFGPVVAPHVAEWIGDVVVATTGAFTIVDSRTQTANSLELKGVHGSLTPPEMLVPLLVTVTG